MTPERWQQIKAVLDAASSLEGRELQTYLDRACCSDADLRFEVEALLSSLDAAGPNFLSVCDRDVLTNSFVTHSQGDSVIAMSATAITPPAAEFDLIGHRLGPYEIVSQIGMGGMGEVYRAIRADDEYRKEVAIKLVRAGYGAQWFLNRLRNERQILATLEHPNICRLLDGGTTESGLAYLVMELIEGQPIDEYCRQQKLCVSDRVNLFLQVCSAVQYAHQRLIIHRDLKPANILVTEDGGPKLLDFGIAKVLDPNATGNPTRTMTLLQAMTPIYASPEQVRGEPITTASDVYSLGVVLYELLAGRSPYRIVNHSTQAVTQVICDQEPLRPSTAALQPESSDQEKSELDAAANVKLSQQLRGDLDNILLMALRKEPDRRYPSVEQFAEDIRRHLRSLPVVASRGTARYRARKFVARHRSAVAAGVALALVVITGVAATVYEAHRARQNELRAERRFNDVRKLANSVLFEMHDSIKDLPGSTPARELLVERALYYLDNLASETDNDPGLSRELAAAYGRVGELQGAYLVDNLGETSSALTSFEKELRLRKQLGEVPNAEWQDRLSLAEAYRRMAAELMARGRTREALPDAQSAISITESMARVKPRDSKVLDELGFDYQILGKIQSNAYLSGLGDMPSALHTYALAIQTDQNLLELNPNDLEAQRSLASDTMQIGDAQNDLGHPAEALDNYRKALQLFTSIAQTSNTVRDRRKIAVVYNQIATIYDAEEKWGLSLENHQKGLEIYKQLIAQDPKNRLLQQGLAIAYVNTGETESKAGNARKGSSDIAKGIEIMRPVVEADANAEQRGVLAEMYIAKAESFERSSSRSQARDEYRRALSIFESIDAGKSDSGRRRIARCHLGIADAEKHLGEWENAKADFQKVIALSAPQLKSSHHDDLRSVARAYAGLGDLEALSASRSTASKSRKQDWKAAVQFYGKSLKFGTQIPANDRREFRTNEVEEKLNRARKHVGDALNWRRAAYRPAMMPKSYTCPKVDMGPIMPAHCST